MSLANLRHVQSGVLNNAKPSGSVSFEVVLATATILPVLIVSLYFALDACRGLYRIIASLVGWVFL